MPVCARGTARVHMRTLLRTYTWSLSCACTRMRVQMPCSHAYLHPNKRFNWLEFNLSFSLNGREKHLTLSTKENYHKIINLHHKSQGRDTHLDTAWRSPLRFQSTAIWGMGHDQSYPRKLCLGIPTNKPRWRLLGLKKKGKTDVTNQSEREPGQHLSELADTSMRFILQKSVKKDVASPMFSSWAFHTLALPYPAQAPTATQEPLFVTPYLKHPSLPFVTFNLAGHRVLEKVKRGLLSIIFHLFFSWVRTQH